MNTNPSSSPQFTVDLENRNRELETALRACLDDRKQYARKLSQARGLLRDMMRAHTADTESYEEEDAYALQVWKHVERFLSKPALRARGKANAR